MSRRLERLILQAIDGTRYGCTVGQLAYLAGGVGRGDGPSDADARAVDREVRRLLDEGRIVERTSLGTERYLFPATIAVPGPAPLTLECVDCDLRWVSEEGAPHPLCWSCGEPGRPAKARPARH
jgi:hypothetical protein